MPNFTTPIPPRLTGDSDRDVGILKNWGTALIDELTYLFNNLDSGNVIEAASVKAENIETKNAKISNAQIGALSADKLVAGSVDTGLVSVKDSNGRLEISGSQIVISDKNTERFIAAFDPDTNTFRFELYNKKGEPTVSINSGGDAVFGGILESATIFSSTIIGTDSDSYEEIDGGVFADIDQKGIKVMQDDGGARQQKIGMSVADDGTAYLVLGAGNGDGRHSINGVVYTNGSFIEEKNESYARLGLVGYKPQIHFWENSEELWLSGDTVLINGRDVLNEIDQIKDELKSITA
ncbi:MAG: hypothetical protein U0M60_22410 [Clostridia bacterium]|nr:hypothetical protein [Clostridia bacterium]